LHHDIERFTLQRLDAVLRIGSLDDAVALALERQAGLVARRLTAADLPR